MKVKVSDAAAGIAEYQFDTLEVANRLNTIAGRVRIGEMAIGGLADDHGLIVETRQLRELLAQAVADIRAVAADVHHSPGAPAAQRLAGGAP